MPKRILLVDNELKIVEHILKETDWIIEVLITIEKNNRYRRNARIKKIYSETDFFINADLRGLNFAELELFWHAQLKVENGYNRGLVDYQMGKWNYYRGYVLTKRIYDEHAIDAVIVKGHNHGYVYDRLIMEMATQRGITSYNIMVLLNSTRSVYNNIKKELVKVGSVNQIDLKKSLFYRVPQNNETTYDKSIWNNIYEIAYKMGGLLGIETVRCIRNHNLGENIYGVTVLEKIKQYIKIKNAQNYLKTIAVDLDIRKKYICYAMHLEPEAAVSGMAEMDSQIVVIQMLASCLPPGWKLYVKEHPHQFDVNTKSLLYGNLYGAGALKTKRFYEEINKIKNVSFLKKETDMKKIITNCQAMATMTGTIAAETATYGKPVLVFAPERTLYKMAKGFYNITSYDECKNAIGKIMNREQVCYDDFEEVCNKYLIDFSNESSGYQRAVEVIKADIDKVFADK